MKEENVKLKKLYAFDIGSDKGNPKITKEKIEKMGLAYEKAGFDTFSVFVYELNNGKKVAGITVMGFKGDYEKWYKVTCNMIVDKAKPGNCVISISSIKEDDGIESYTIFFDYEDYPCKCLDGDCQDGIGTFIYSNGDKYEGEWRDGKMHGNGKMVFANGDVYDGQWKDGKMDGEGTLTKADSSVQKGKWKNGEFSGSSCLW